MSSCSPSGFLCDHVEILYDIDIAFKARPPATSASNSRERGALNGSATLIRALKSIAEGSYQADVDELPQPLPALALAV